MKYYGLIFLLINACLLEVAATEASLTAQGKPLATLNEPSLTLNVSSAAKNKSSAALNAEVNDYSGSGRKSSAASNERPVLFSKPKLLFEKIHHPFPKKIKSKYYGVTKDSKGNLWVATNKGLFKYNGDSFSYLDSLSRLFSDSYFSALYADNNDRLWFSVSTSTNYVDLKTGVVKSLDGHVVTNPDLTSFINSSSSLLEHEDRLWLGRDAQIDYYDLNTNELVKCFYHEQEYDGKEPVFISFYLSGDHLWAGTFNEGFFRININDCTGKNFVDFYDHERTRINRVEKVLPHPDNPDWLILATAQGLLLFDRNSEQFTRYPQHQPIREPVRGLIVDKENTLWVGGDHLYQIKNDAISTIYYRDKDFGADSEDSHISELFMDEQDTLFVFMFNAGIYRASPYTSKVKIFNDFPVKSHDVTAIKQDTTGHYWLGFEDALFKARFDGHQLRYQQQIKADATSFDRVRKIHIGVNGQIWVAEDKTLTRIDRDGKTQSFSINTPLGSYIEEIVQDKNGFIWINFHMAGVAHFNPYNGILYTYPEIDMLELHTQIDVFFMLSPDRSKLAYGINKRFGVIDVDTINIIPETIAAKADFVREKEIPLFIWNFAEGDEQGFFTLYNNEYFSVYDWTCACFNLTFPARKKRILSLLQNPRQKDKVWLFEQDGDIVFWDRKQSKDTLYSQAQGLPLTGINARVNALANNNGVFVSTKKGLAWVMEPDQYLANPHKPDTYLDGIAINNQPVVASEFGTLPMNIAYLDNMVLEHDKNNLKLFFHSTSTAPYDTTRFRYRLHGYNDEWLDANLNELSATYTNLDYGDYTFEVASTNSDGIWGPSRALHVVIKPAWWETWLARMVYVLLVAGGIVLYFRWRTRVIIVRAEDAEAMVAQRTQELTLRTQELTSKTEALAKMSQELAHINERDRKFVVGLTHALRTPLSILSGIHQQLGGAGAETQHRAQSRPLLDLANNTVNELLRKIDLLLAKAKFEKSAQGRGETMFEALDFSQILKQILVNFKPYAESKNIELRHTIEANLITTGDRYSIGEVILNLLSNAVKYNKPGGCIKVSLSAHQEYLLYVVEDSGIGIPDEKIEIILQEWAFDHQENMNANTYSSGLGLAVVNEIVKTLGGQLRVSSQVDVGSTFTVQLPLISSEEVPESVARSVSGYYIERELQHTDASLLNQHHEHDVYQNPGYLTEPEQENLVLIVEDNPHLASQIKKSLNNEFYVLVAPNGRAALSVIETFIPKVVVSDVMMPELDGIALVEAMRSNKAMSHIPLIMLTANTDEQTKLTALGLGANDYLYKPVKAEELFLRVRNIVHYITHFHQQLEEAPIEQEQVITEEANVNFAQVANEWRTVVNEWLESILPDNPTVEACAKVFDMKPNTFSVSFKRIMGVAPSRYFNEFKLKKAESFLATDMPLIDIAMACGFSSQAHFSHSFKKKYELTPKAYRAQLSP